MQVGGRGRCVCVCVCVLLNAEVMFIFINVFVNNVLTHVVALAFHLHPLHCIITLSSTSHIAEYCPYFSTVLLCLYTGN